MSVSHCVREDNSIVFTVKVGVYSENAILNAAHGYSKMFVVKVSRKSDCIDVVLTPKKENIPPTVTTSAFYNDLLDHEIRVRTFAEYKSVHDALLDKAFRPISV